jgi:cation transport ATPase
MASTTHLRWPLRPWVWRWALGLIPPTIGAIVQEILDVAVILNALRAR